MRNANASACNVDCLLQQQELVAHAQNNGSIIVYDAAYALYISDRNCPKSIFEIEGEIFRLSHPSAPCCMLQARAACHTRAKAVDCVLLS